MGTQYLLAIPSMPELLVVLFIVLLLFGGAKKIPQLMGSFGKGIKNFKKSISEDDEEIEDSSIKNREIENNKIS